MNSSQQVNWYDEVYLWVKPWLDAAGGWPMIGTPAWSELDDTDPRKWAAVLDAAQHWALRVETRQAATAEASQAISAAENWPAIATEIYRRSGAYIRRKIA